MTDQLALRNCIYRRSYECSCSAQYCGFHENINFRKASPFDFLSGVWHRSVTTVKSSRYIVHVSRQCWLLDVSVTTMTGTRPYPITTFCFDCFSTLSRNLFVAVQKRSSLHPIKVVFYHRYKPRNDKFLHHCDV